jgi:hypothetical protein
MTQIRYLTSIEKGSAASQPLPRSRQGRINAQDGLCTSFRWWPRFAHERHNLRELADTRPGSRAYGISPFGRRRRLSCTGAQALMLEECPLRERAAPISTKPVSHHRRRRCILSSWSRFLTGSGAPPTFVWTISTQWSAASRVDGGLLRVRAEEESKSEGAGRQPNGSRAPA